MAPSATRSMVESSAAPNRVGPALSRAMVPSSRSVNANSVTIRVPAMKWPRAPNPTAPATAPAVPTTVTAFGLTPARSSARATGSTTWATTARASTLKIFAMAPPP